MSISARRVILTSIAVDTSDVIINLLVAVITGSVTMVAETLLAVADLINDLMLLTGLSRSQKKPDAKHPFGYGKEAYFWSMIASVLMLTITAGMIFYFGWWQIVNHEEIGKLWLAYLVLIISTATNSYSLSLSSRRLLGNRSWRDIIKTFTQSPFVSTKTTFAMDLTGTLSAVFGLVALLVSGYTGSSVFDGLGAISIGIMVVILALVLLTGIRGFIVGQSVNPVMKQKIVQTVEAHPEVQSVLDLRTMLVGPEHILVNVEIHVQDNLTTDQIEILIDEIKSELIKTIPTITHVQVELETPTEEQA